MQWKSENNEHRTAQGDSWELILTILHENALQFYPITMISAAITG
jgi:hypothetical protein